MDRDFLNCLESDYEELVKFLEQYGYKIEKVPESVQSSINEGSAFSIAYPIQGILKYHGLYDRDKRIAYFPSISLNNDCVVTITYLKFSKSFDEDTYYLNGEKLENKGFLRIKKVLDTIRKFSGIDSKALVISGNFIAKEIDQNKFDNEVVIEKGKGLGTSASGGAALATAAVNILYRDNPKIKENKQLISYFARYLAGSASRSVVGGLGLWLSHPKLDLLKNVALRLDGQQHEDFINNIKLITCSIESQIQTEDFHRISTKSPFFKEWALDRKDSIKKLINALNSNDFAEIGTIAEYDTLCLHSISMTGEKQRSHVLWEPETIAIIRIVEQMRNRGKMLYYSIDTGPSVVIMCYESNVNIVLEKLQSINLQSKIQIHVGNIGSESQIVDKNSKFAQFLNTFMNNFGFNYNLLEE